MNNHKGVTFLSLPGMLLGALGEALRLPNADLGAVSKRIQQEWHTFFLLRDLAKSDRDWQKGKRHKFKSVDELFK